MTAALAQLDQLASIPLERVLDSTIERNETVITDLNRDQLDKGLDSNGKSLGQYSSVKYKGRLRPVDLLDTGAFRGSIYTDPFGSGFSISATDEKTEKLTNRYGPDILGISEADQQRVAGFLADALINHLRQSL
ncbi:hypothetical protein GGR92_005268 [Spirosoma lacussanchae]|uniref:hypothetical protein n=1 Tax=Spirosoma lacussanchae TaxID=1884249 RepID=UPI001109DAC2|nr:hypothetical protein [Spirosoma lacussanchae]